MIRINNDKLGCSYRNITFVNFKRFNIFLVRIDNWLYKIYFPALQGSHSLKQGIRLSFDPSVARFKSHDLKDFLIVSGLIPFHAFRIQLNIARRGVGFKFPG